MVKSFSFIKKAGSAVALSVVGGAAMAEGVNAGTQAASAAAELTTNGLAAIGAVGVAMLTLAGAAVVYKWAKAAFFS
ncbi:MULTISPECIES: hypothetical protein [Shewanella]|uniref:hypothetical protein n=1 Tax=Shewanella TaxID=22 RepID=UPI0031F534C2